MPERSKAGRWSRLTSELRELRLRDYGAITVTGAATPKL